MRRLTVTLALGLTLGVTLTGCGDDDQTKEPAPVQTTAAAPPAGPAAGACYQLPYEIAVAPTTEIEPVDCTAAHTSETVAVGDVQAISDGHLLAIDSDLVQKQVASTCPKALSAYVGGSLTALRLSMIRPIWFTPTVKESDEGSRWYRCDAVLLAGTSTLAELTGSLKGVLGRTKGRDKYAMCGTAAPDAEDFQRVLCSAKHSWRAIAVVDLGDAEAYPGEKKVKSAGKTICENAAADVAKDPLVFAWGYEWPTEEQWSMGQRFGRCWAPEPK